MKIYLCTGSYSLPHIGHFLPQIAHARAEMAKTHEPAVVFFSASHESHMHRKYDRQIESSHGNATQQNTIKARRARVLSAKKRNRLFYQIMIAHKPDDVVVLYRNERAATAYLKALITTLQENHPNKIIVIVDDTLEAIHDHLRSHHRVCDELARNFNTHATYLPGDDVSNRKCCQRQHEHHSVETIARPQQGQELSSGMSSTALERYLFESARVADKDEQEDEKKEASSENQTRHIDATYALVLPRKHLRDLPQERRDRFKRIYQSILANINSAPKAAPNHSPENTPLHQEALRIYTTIDKQNKEEQILRKLETIKTLEKIDALKIRLETLHKLLSNESLERKLLQTVETKIEEYFCENDVGFDPIQQAFTAFHDSVKANQEAAWHQEAMIIIETDINNVTAIREQQISSSAVADFFIGHGEKDRWGFWRSSNIPEEKNMSPEEIILHMIKNPTGWWGVGGNRTARVLSERYGIDWYLSPVENRAKQGPWDNDLKRKAHRERFLKAYEKAYQMQEKLVTEFHKKHEEIRQTENNEDGKWSFLRSSKWARLEDETNCCKSPPKNLTEVINHAKKGFCTTNRSNTTLSRLGWFGNSDVRDQGWRYHTNQDMVSKLIHGKLATQPK